MMIRYADAEAKSARRMPCCYAAADTTLHTLLAMPHAADNTRRYADVVVADAAAMPPLRCWLC